MKIMAVCVALAIASVSFSAGTWLHAYFRGSVRVFTNVNEGTALNHGQKSLEVQFPSGVRFDQIKLGNCTFPGDGPRWVQVSPTGQEETWIDHLWLEAGN
jgi:hypothetical protein